MFHDSMVKGGFALTFLEQDLHVQLTPVQCISLPRFFEAIESMLFLASSTYPGPKISDLIKSPERYQSKII